MLRPLELLERALEWQLGVAGVPNWHPGEARIARAVVGVGRVAPTGRDHNGSIRTLGNPRGRIAPGGPWRIVGGAEGGEQTQRAEESQRGTQPGRRERKRAI